MLDLNAQCPRCGTRLTGPDERCVICHESFDKSRSQRFRRRVAIAIGVPVVSALVAVLAWPALLSGWPWRAAGAPAQAAPTAWSYGAPEPAARVWAAQLEPNLTAVCRETHARMSGPKHMGAFIAQRLFAADQVAANLAARTPRWRQLTSEEEQDALGSMGGEAQFMGACLRWSYEAIAGCSAHAGHLGSSEAAACLVPPVQRALGTEPWRICARAAKLEQVQRSCSEVAILLGRAADEGRPVQ